MAASPPEKEARSAIQVPITDRLRSASTGAASCCECAVTERRSLALGEHPGTGPAALMTDTPPFNITLINEAETYIFKSRSFPPAEERHRIGLQKQLHWNDRPSV